MGREVSGKSQYRQLTQVTNAIRAHLAEFGIVVPIGVHNVGRLLCHTDLTHRRGIRCALSLQTFNLPKLRYNLLGLLSYSSHR
ncbi:hypothetical protein SAMN05216224_1076 [Thioclava dalianensis]|nr:hypothetical protein SAMN05216224_1076 [Thioclava dalianensis]